ncbi:MAG: enoyl-CoA hydratase-related protein [Thermoplasmata archaeon]
MAIEYTKEGTIGVIRMNNPPMNVLSSAVLAEFHAILSRIEEDKGLDAVIITGEGRAFVAGADIGEMAVMDPASAAKFAEAGQGACDRIQALRAPVIAAVNGFALGGGTEMAISCDIRIASEAAKFGQPEVNLGVIPGFGGTQRLARLIGPGKAKELIFTGEMIDAKAALDIGLVQAVVPGFKRAEDGQMLLNEKGKPIQDNEPVFAAAMAMAKTIATKGPLSVQMAKESIDRGLDQTLSEGLKTEAGLFSELFGTEDQKEGMKAFTEKRPAQFKRR